VSVADLLPQSSTRSTRGRCPVYAFKLDGNDLDVLAQSATVRTGENEHDQASITVSSPTLTTTEGMTDKPISFRWGVERRLETFAGYVTDVKEDTAQGSGISLSFTMSVMGATKNMFDGEPHYWANKSVPSAVRDLASKNLLGYTGHTHDYLWQALAQTSESDWEYAGKLAKRLGWQLTNRYGVVQCYDPLKLFREQGTYTRLVMGGATGLNIQADRILLDFQPMEEADVLNTNLGRKYGYFTSSGDVQIVSQPGDFPGYTFSTDIVIADQDAAKVYADSGNIDMDRWTQYALARIWGDADIYPGMCVEVITTNKAYLKTKYDGKWLVRQVAHTMDRQSYQTLLSLARPDGKTTVSTPTYVPFWQAQPIGQELGRPKPTLYLKDAVDEDSHRTWASSWADRYVGSIL
jgi:hypothetical protein